MSDEQTTTTPAGQTTEGQASSQAAGTAGVQGQGGTAPPGAQPPGEGTNTEGQGAGAQGADAGKKQGEGEPAGAPEKYEIKPPEGVEFSADGLQAFEAFARKQNLSNEAAQALLGEMAPALAKNQTERVAALQAEWGAQAKADKEFGGEHFDTNLAEAKKALGQFATPEFVQFLNQSALGDHPEMIRAFYRISKAVGEDGKFVSGGSAGSEKNQSVAQRLYPNMNP